MENIRTTARTNARTVTAMLLRVISLSMAFTFAGLALADPPMRVARLGYFSGGVSFSPAGEADWVAGTLNRPLITGDRLWADERGRVELQIGNAVVRLGTRTLFTLTNLDDRIVQMNLQDGTINLRVRRLERGQVVEVDTPNLAFVIRQAGEYRVTVDAARDSTEVRTRSGRADVYGKGASYAVGLGRAYRFFGAGLADYDVLTLPRADEFDRWAQARDSRYDTSVSARYVSRDVIGYQDLDQYGSWRSIPEYGNVWTPTRVAANWAPYRDGHWSWVEPWGWTWVDDLPWGFAVSHYGRWINNGGRWGWIPGPTTARAVYAPALVAFIGGSNFQVSASSGNVGAVGWFPLGPREVYRPAYAVSREYFTNVNISNTVINNTTIINNYDNRNSSTVVANAVYVNQRVPGAVVAVPTAAFVQSQPVARAATRVSEAAVVAATVTTLAAVAPTPISVRGAAAQRALPPAAAQPRFVAQSQPPAPAVGFAVRERVLAANPGKPVDTAALTAMKPVAPEARAAAGAPAAVAAPRVEIVPQAREASPAVVAPPPRAPSDRTGNREQPSLQAVPPSAQMPPAAPSGSPPPSAARPPAATPAETVKPGNPPREQRDNPTVASPVPPTRVLPSAQPQPAPIPTPAPAGARPPTPAPQEVRERGNPPSQQRDAPGVASPTPTAPPARGQPTAQPQPAPVPTPAPAVARPPSPAPQEVRERSNQPSEPPARPVTAAPVPTPPVAAPPPPRSSSPGNPAREQREAPAVAAPAVVAPSPTPTPTPTPAPTRVPPSARPPQQSVPVPSVAEPVAPQRGRDEPPPTVKPPSAPATPVSPPAAVGRPAEPVAPANPPPRSANADKKPVVVDEKSRDKQVDKVDEEGKPQPDDKEKKRR